MTARSILDHFNVTSCYHFVNDILNSNLSCFWGLSLFLSILISYCVKTFFFLNKTTHFYFIYGQHRAQTFIYMNCKFEKLYSLCPPPPPLLFLSLYERTSSGKGLYRQCRLPIQIMFKFFKEYTCMNVLIRETFSRGVDDP